MMINKVKYKFDISFDIFHFTILLCCTGDSGELYSRWIVPELEANLGFKNL